VLGINVGSSNQWRRRKAKTIEIKKKEYKGVITNHTPGSILFSKSQKGIGLPKSKKTGHGGGAFLRNMRR